RHPHVFGDTVAETAADVVDRWDELKKTEKPGRTSVLDGIPNAMPSLLLADKVLGRAEKVGVAPHPQPTGTGVAPETEEELGALLLGLVADARGRGLDSE